MRVREKLRVARENTLDWRLRETHDTCARCKTAMSKHEADEIPRLGQVAHTHSTPQFSDRWTCASHPALSLPVLPVIG